MTYQDVIAHLESIQPGGIDASRVEEIYVASLAEGLSESSLNYKVTEGVLRPTAFNMEKLERHREEVAAMLSWLPTEFRPMDQGGGGGWSFLQACMDREGRQWTGLHRTQDQLFQLGIALGMAEWLAPRNMWDIFPGGMPYAAITLPLS